MKQYTSPSIKLLALALGLAVAGISQTPSAQAASLTWDSDATFDGNFGGTGTWNTSTTNWSGVASDVAWTTNTIAGDTAVFAGTAGTVTLGTAINALGLQFTTTGYTVTGNTLSVGTGGIDASTLSSGTTTVGSAFVVGDSQTWTVGSGASLVLGSTVTGAASATKTLTVGGAGNTTINGLLDDGASGTLNLTKTGAGYLKLNGGATNIAGALDIQGGTVGVVQDFTATGLTGTGTFENASNNDKWTFWNIGTNQTFAGVFRNNNGVNTGLLGIVKSGTGTLTLTNNSSNQSSNLSVNAGRLVLNNTGTFGAGSQGGATKTFFVAEIGTVAGQNGVLEINGATVNYNNRSDSGTEIWRSTLNVGTNATGAGALKMTSGSLSTNRQISLATANGAYGAMTQTGGTTNVGGFLALAVGGTNARGVVNVSGGNFNQAGPVTDGAGAGGIGVINLSGSAVYNQTSTGGDSLWVGESGTGMVNVSGSASLSIVSGNDGLQLGRNAGSVGVVNLLGGTVTAKAVYNGAGAGTLNFNGGTLKANIANTSFLTGLTNAYVNNGGGTIDNGGFAIGIGQALLATTGSGVSATGLTVSGSGYIDTPVVTISGGGGSGATAVATIDGSGNLAGIVMTNPGIGYTSAPTFTLSGGGIGNTGTLGGAATLVTNTSGGMTFKGSGTTTLTGANTYAGATTVNAGALAIGSSGSVNSSSGITISGSGAKLVQNSSTALTPAITLTQGTLDGTTTVGAVTVGAGTGGIVTNGDGGATALTIGSLTFNGAATTNISLNGFSGGGLAVTGALTTSGSGVLVNVVNNTTWTSGTYNLISYGSFSGALANFTKGTIPGLGVRQSSVLVNTGNSIGLAIAGDTPFWTGAESADWTTAAIGGDKNWALVTDNTPTDFINGDVALFDDNANRVDVNITGNVSPVIMNIEGGNNFTFSSTNGSIITTSGTAVPAVTVNKNGSGSAAISTNNNFGTGAVTVSGGLLALSGSNSYTGATAVNAGGVLSVQNSGALGASSGVTVASGAELQVQGNITVDRPITLSGSGLGSGALHNVSGSNTWSGPVTLGADSTIQSDAGTLVLAGGTLAGSGQALTLTGSGDGVVSSVIGTGTGTVTKDGLGTWTLTGSNTYTGATTVASGTLNVATGGVINNTAVTSISGASGGSAVLSIAGGSLTTTAGGAVWEPTVNVGYTSGGAGALKLGSGALSVSKQLGLGNNGGYGAYTQTGGTASVGGFLALGLGTSAGVFNQSGGTFTQAGPVTDGADASGIGVINLSGNAVYSQTSTVDSGFLANEGVWVGENGTGMLNVSGSASLSIVSGNNGLQLGRNASGVGVVNLLGGTVTTKAVYKGAGAGTLNFNGGTLKANIANTSFLTGLTNAYVYGGGGTIDNNGYGITIGQALLATSGSGVSASGLAITGGSGYIDTPVVAISGGGGTGATAVATVSGGVVTGIAITNPGIGYTSVPTFTLNGGGGSGASIGAGTATVVANTSGGLTFTGTGTTTLTGASTYTGATTVSNGTLIVGASGSLGATATTVASGAAIGGDGSIGGSLTLNSGAKFVFSLTETLTVNGSSVSFGGFSIANLVGLDSSVAAATYTLIDGSATINLANVSNIGLANAASIGGGKSAYFQSGSLQLVVVPEPGTFAMLLGGAGMLTLFRRRRA